MTWARCRDAHGTVHWPDGGAYLDQPERLIEAFGIVGREWPKYDKER